jgi:hypothetical protein
LSLYADEVSGSLSKEERKRLLDEFAFMPEQPDMKASMANAKNVVGRPVARQALKKIMQEAKEQQAIEAENQLINEAAASDSCSFGPDDLQVAKSKSHMQNLVSTLNQMTLKRPGFRWIGELGPVALPTMKRSSTSMPTSTSTSMLTYTHKATSTSTSTCTTLSTSITSTM